MTDENTRLPSDSVVEGDLAFISALAECAIAHGKTILTKETAVSLLGVVRNLSKALAAHPRDDVRELLREAAAFVAAKGAFSNRYCKDFLARIDTALSQGDEQPAIPDMTDAECATAYRDLRKRANDAGFATVGEWIDEQPDTDGLAGELEGLASKATPAPWGIWFEQINGQADNAINELIEQVHSTHPIGDSLVMLDADGKCPAITGCGPTSSYNAALITVLVNNLPTILTALRARTDRKAVLEEAAKACEAQQQIFLSEQYAVNQPVSSISERFACKQCAEAIRALAEGAGK